MEAPVSKASMGTGLVPLQDEVNFAISFINKELLNRRPSSVVYIERDPCFTRPPPPGEKAISYPPYPLSKEVWKKALLHFKTVGDWEYVERVWVMGFYYGHGFFRAGKWAIVLAEDPNHVLKYHEVSTGQRTQKSINKKKQLETMRKFNWYVLPILCLATILFIFLMGS